MKKEIEKIYDDKVTFENVSKTWKVVRKTCKNRRAIFRYSINKNINNYIIYRILKEKKYKPYPFRLFLIFEPKARLVMSQTVADKIINHFVTNYYLLPYLERKLIDQNVATRKNKGSSYANKLVVDYINEIRLKNKQQEIYCLKLDISKYFYSINHQILLEKIEKEIEDKDVINLIKIIINETNKPYINDLINKYNEKYNTEIPIYEFGTGLSIGAMTSQFLAIFYLNDLDHYIKEKLHVKYYIRYMDDFLIFGTDKNYLKNVASEISKQLIELKLKINPKSGIYKLSGGISFLGYSYKIQNNKLRISYRKKTYTKIIKKLKSLKKIDMLKYYRSYASYYGYLNKINLQERNFKMKILDKYKYYKEKYPNHIIFIKEGSFYKTFEDDAILIWHLFDYKWNRNCIAFGAQPCSKVSNKLKYLEISYIIINSGDDVLCVDYDSENYIAYLTIAKNKYNRYNEKCELNNLLDEVIDNNKDCYSIVRDFLLNLKNDN